MKSGISLSIVFLVLTNLCLAQGGWQTIYPIQSNSPYGDGIESVRQTPDGGYILAGMSELNSAASQNRIVKVNDQGIVQWSNSYSAVGNYSWATNIELSPNGGYFIEGYRTNPVSFAREVYLQRLDANGNQLWLNFYPQAQVATKGDITNDGGFIQIGYYDNNGIQDTLSVIKTDESGNLQWLRKYPNTGTGIERIPTSIIQTLNGEFVVAGYKDQGFGGLNFLWRLDASGDSLWQNTYGVQMNHPEYIGQVLELEDSSIVALGNDALTFGANDFYLYRTDPNGYLLWEKYYQQANAFGTHLDATSDGGFILTGYQLLSSLYNVILIKTDIDGNQQWLKTYNGYSNGSFKPYCVQQTSDGGYIVGGAKLQGPYTRTNMYLIKTDELGEIYGNTLQGYIYADANANCSNDPEEYKFQNWMVKATGNQTFLTSSDETGFYWVRVDTGNYQVTLHPTGINPYWENASCTNDTLNISITQPLTTIDTSFAQTASAFCPLLTVDMGTPFLRRCFNNTYAVQYCNTGTAAAEDAFINVEFDDFLIVDNSSINVPFTQIDSQNYQFDIGNVQIGECGSISISVLVSCDALLGQTHCSNAEIFPNQSCLEPIWEGPVVALEAECRNDSVVFTVSNSGSDMLEPVDFTVIENGTIIDMGIVELAAAQSQEISYIANENASYRINVNQAQGLPAILGDPIASIAVLGCGSIESEGWVVQLSDYDGSPFIDIDCHQNIGAYDPNDKQASPVGYGEEHFIKENNDLEYLIRFQNTGTDTAFTIVIRDTISQFLDITSIQPGSSSHNYAWRVYGEDVQAVEFTFNNIMLPDSFVNEPASNGFIKYRIKQLENNQIGTIINNTAAIYFDFNEPIFTNATFHEIGEDFIEEVLITSDFSSILDLQRTKVYPNPFNQSTRIEFQGESKGNFNLEVYNSLGQLVQEYQSKQNYIDISQGTLKPGVYFYTLKNNTLLIDSGKMIIE